MQIGDSHFAHLLSDQGVIKDTRKERKVEDDRDPLDSVAQDEDAPRLMDPGKMRALVNQKKFDLGDVKESAEELKNARGFKADEGELKAIKKELKELHGEMGTGPRSPHDAKRLEWINLAEKGVKDSLEDIRKTGRSIKWDKLTGEMGTEPPRLYEAYFKETDVPPAELKEIMSLTDDLHRSDSVQKIRGNSVEPLMKGQIWATKMKLLDEVIENPVKDGKPVEIDAEYYELASPEMIKRLRAAAGQGAKVRVLMDPGCLQGGGRDPLDASSMAVRGDTVHQLMEGMDDKDMGVTLFPNHELLGGRDKIMHRKIFRVGDTVVFGGMNANAGSGENVDFAMKIKGPATKRMGELFRDDVAKSAGASLEDIYGNQVDLVENSPSPVTLSSWGFQSLLGATAGAEGRSSPGAGREKQIDTLLEGVAGKGIEVSSLAEFSDRDGDGRVSAADVKAALLSDDAKAMTLTARGRGLLAEVAERTVGKTGEGRNMERLEDITPPDGRLPDGMEGKDVITVGNSSVERQTMVLDAMNSADKFIKVSAFVLNDDMAKLLIEKKREKEGLGEDFNVQVVMDPGVYGYGGTPNEAAYKRLEDAGVPVKWSMLDRTDSHHDRKNHSKLIITDKMILTGSTNFSSKGLRANWEVNDAVYFSEENPESVKKQAEVVKEYDRMWSREAIGIDTIALTNRKYASYKGDDRAVRIDKSRGSAVKDFIKNIENFEVQMGERLSREAERRDVQEALARRTARGESRGYALLGCFSDEQMDEMRRGLPAWKKLQDMKGA